MKLEHKLVIAVSSRALFDLESEHDVFLEDKKKYEKLQMDKQNVILQKGNAFHLIEKLLKLNTTKTVNGDSIEAVEVIVISQNSLTTGRRAMNSIKHYGLPITRFVFTGGDNPAEYVCNEDMNIHLFLSLNKEAVKWALDAGIPSAVLMSKGIDIHKSEIRFAFDGDAVLFTDASELIFQTKGLEEFQRHEIEMREAPLDPGPFKKLFLALGDLTSYFPSIVKIGLFTARGGVATERVLNTFFHWGITPEHGAFLGGVTKRYFLKAFRADMFFDDHPKHCSEAMDHVSSAHVPSGITNGEGVTRRD